MSSTYEDQPLPEGRYYVVDISEPVAEYMSLPQNVRLVGAVMPRQEFTPMDMLDIELSAIIPCLDSRLDRVDGLKDHAKDLLEEANERKEEELARKEIDFVPDCQENTPAEKQHSEAIHTLGSKIGDILEGLGLYGDDGCLRGEHVTINEHGQLYLRANSR